MWSVNVEGIPGGSSRNKEDIRSSKYGEIFFVVEPLPYAGMQKMWCMIHIFNSIVFLTLFLDGD